MTNKAYELGFRRVGADVTVWPRAHVVRPDLIEVGDRTMIDDFTLIMPGPNGMTIGSFVHVTPFACIMGGGEFEVGDFASISAGVRIFTGKDDFLGSGLINPTVPERYRAMERSFVRIGAHAVIGANSVILPGVVIGTGAAVGACSLVNKDLEPWTVYGGSPARPIKPRPRERMLELERQLRAELYDSEGRYIAAADQTVRS